jgi:starch-binding outer membrane protein, SusD/RagB family
MKRIKLVFVSSFLALFISSSCEDAYNIVQDGELNESAITTVPLLQSWLNGTYGTVSIANEVGFTGIFTDETSIGRGNGGQNLGLHSFFLNAGEGYASAIWYGHYQSINRVNRLMRMVTDPDGAGPLEPQVAVPTDPTELATYNSIIAQARGIRAFCYFQLLTYYSPDLTDDNALGVMLFTHVPEASEELPRVANGLVFAQIEEDLEFAYDNVSPTATYKFISRNMINALRARMYLYRGNYVLAKQYAEDVIANSGLTLTAGSPVPANAPTNPFSIPSAPSAWNTAFYGANTVNPYRRMFADLIQGEIIFALDRPAAGGPGPNIAAQFTTNTTTAGGSPLFEVSRALFAKLGQTPGDVRRYVNVDPSSIYNPNWLTDPNYLATDVIVIDKYPGKTPALLRNDEKVFRLSEMYLILAECLANEGNINGATNSVAAIIKRIRDVRNFLPANQNQPLPVYANATEALSAILNERRVELAFEAHRYIDIKRLGPVTGQTLDRDPTDDQPGSPLSIPNNDHRFTMPIPTDEFNANPGIQQNPGYL